MRERNLTKCFQLGLLKREKVYLMLLSDLWIFILIIMTLESVSNDSFKWQEHFVGGSMSTIDGVNDTFAMSGALLSTIHLNSNLTEEFNNLQTGGIGYEGPVQENQTFDDSIGLFSSDGSPQRPSTLMASNQTDNLSNNLVSMLSGIIIQSIERGNPTINNVNLSDPLQLKRENVPIILAGNWQMSVIQSKVTLLDARFVMITSNGTGFHWHSMNNFKSDMKTYFGTDDNIYLIGTADFLTDNRIVSNEIKIAIMINNMEVVQIIILGDKISSHLYGHPIYGTVDKIEIPN